MPEIEQRSCREAETLAVPHQIVAPTIQSQEIGAEAGSRRPFLCALQDDKTFEQAPLVIPKTPDVQAFFFVIPKTPTSKDSCGGARFTQPQGVSIDCAGNLRVADGGVFRTLSSPIRFVRLALQTLSAASVERISMMVTLCCAGLVESGIIPPTRYWEIVAGKLTAERATADMLRNDWLNKV